MRVKSPKLYTENTHGVYDIFMTYVFMTYFTIPSIYIFHKRFFLNFHFGRPKLLGWVGGVCCQEKVLEKKQKKLDGFPNQNYLPGSMSYRQLCHDCRPESEKVSWSL